MRIAFFTLGCKVNQYETSVMEGMALAAGHTPVGADGAPDAVVVNSCTVTAESDRKTRQMLHRFRRAFPSAVIVVTGCLPQAFPDKIAPEDADVVLGNVAHGRLFEDVDRFLQTGERVVDLTPHERGEKFITPPIERFPERTRAYLKIQDGCERYCTYCAIPKARGFNRSKSPAAVAAEAAVLAANGHKEIVLVGINLSAYGREIGADLADAVDAACGAPGVERVRLGSLEPDLFTDGMLARLQAQPAFCPQFHLALQSGCDATLRRMNRHYDTAFFADLVGRVRAAFPGAAITTDVMVGFPGETEEEFAQSIAFVRKIGFARCHVFAYSRRPGTPAARMAGQVTAAVKQARSRAMIAAGAEDERAFLQAQIGRVQSVLFETYENGASRGYTPAYVTVAAPGPDRRGENAYVRITALCGDGLIGEVVV